MKMNIWVACLNNNLQRKELGVSQAPFGLTSQTRSQIFVEVLMIGINKKVKPEAGKVFGTIQSELCLCGCVSKKSFPLEKVFCECQCKRTFLVFLSNHIKHLNLYLAI